MDFKALLAIIVVLASFGLFAADLLLRGAAGPDPTVAAFTSGGLSLVLGFYFGSHNGAVALAADQAARAASRADTVLALAAQRRHSDPTPSAAIPEEPAA